MSIASVFHALLDQEPVDQSGIYFTLIGLPFAIGTIISINLNKIKNWMQKDFNDFVRYQDANIYLVILNQIVERKGKDGVESNGEMNE